MLEGKMHVIYMVLSRVTSQPVVVAQHVVP